MIIIFDFILKRKRVITGIVWLLSSVVVIISAYIYRFRTILPVPGTPAEGTSVYDQRLVVAEILINLGILSLVVSIVFFVVVIVRNNRSLAKKREREQQIKRT